MTDSTSKRALAPLAIALSASLAVAGCSMDMGQGLTTTRTQGYSISESAVQQIRPGQSVELVTTVLGTPQTRGSFGNETAFYYVETKVQSTAFGLDNVQERTVLAVYFDENRRVKDKAIYGLEDGRVFAIESRRTPSFGEDRTFVQQILGSVGL